MLRSLKKGTVLVWAAVLLADCAKSPVNEIKAAEDALRAALASGARRCAPDSIKSAEEMMQRVYDSEKAKDYGAAKDLAGTTKALAEQAKAEADKKGSAECPPEMAAPATDASMDGVKLGGAGLSEADAAKEIAATKMGEGALGDGSLVRGLKSVHFGYDDANLSKEDLDIVTENSEWLKDRPTVSVQVEGHTDERGTAEYNMALGERRAKAVRDTLIRLGVESKRVTIISYGEELPSSQGHDEAAWQQNRRGEFVVK